MTLAIIFGVIIGTLMGALGGGGAILAVPVLVYIFGFPAQHATLGSLAVVATGALTGGIAHAKAGNIDARKGLTFGALGIAGTFLGRYLSAGVHESLLMGLFAALIAIVATVMLTKALKKLPRQPTKSIKETSKLRVVLVATLVGLLAGFFGVGGGFIIVPALTLLLGLGMRTAVGTSLLVILINSLSGLLAGVGQIPQLDWHTLGAMAAATALSSLSASLISHKLPQQALRISFALLLYLVAAYVAVNSLVGAP